MKVLNKSKFVVEYFYKGTKGYLKPNETISVDEIKEFRSNFIDMLEIVYSNNVKENNKEKNLKENNDTENKVKENEIKTKEKIDNSQLKNINKDINEMSLQELKKLAKELGINPNLKKVELVKEIKKAKGD